jgi:hypothetical protein
MIKQKEAPEGAPEASGYWSFNSPITYSRRKFSQATRGHCQGIVRDSYRVDSSLLPRPGQSTPGRGGMAVVPIVVMPVMIGGRLRSSANGHEH